MQSKFALSLILVVVSLTGSCGSVPDPRGPADTIPRFAAEAEPDPGGPLAVLAWMAGSWRAVDARGATEELWLAPRGGLMLGLNRTVRSGADRASFEFLRIEAESNGVFYRASPSGGPAVAFRLVEADAARAVFVNRQHDFPKRIEYRLEGAVLVAAIFGDEPGPVWRFERAASAPE